MASSQERSELERRFEILFSQVFRCDWREYLSAQYEVQADGQTYYIDYVYQGPNQKIGIELDGREKFFRYKHVFSNFFQRQNAIQLAGVRIYRFSWADVVEQGGWRARKQLLQIFKSEISKHSQSSNSAPLLLPARVSGQSYHPQPMPSQAFKSYTEAEVIDYQPWPPEQKLTGFQWGVLALLSIGTLFLVINALRPSAPPEEAKMPEPISTSAPAQTEPLRISQPSQAQSSFSHQPPRVAKSSPIHTVPQAKAQKPVTHPVGVTPPSKSPILPPSLNQTEPQPVQIVSEPIEAKPATATSSASVSTPDEIVAFNQQSGIYHKPNSYWANKCTRNCIYIPKSQAIQMGGRPSRSE
ncbi:hypothetical protein [Vampirovibrio chlorellavorus]|uniref:hypothetical protein n=1 Tax=Vampirovibrio chlorellavorus TaxID=758823 RepID=UPI0026E93C93|nr:hypothetical protein [Vampirovibrio chlorellavorus]